MDEAGNKKAETASQAWRRKPRQWAPKSRLGCKTCKIRRVKCDLSRPSCSKCHSTGRICDGYGETPFVLKPEIESIHHRNEEVSKIESCDGYHPYSMTTAYQPNLWHGIHHHPISRNLGPFMFLPMNGSAEAEAMCFFESISIRHLNEYYPCESWRNALMFFSQTVPSVRFAAIALSLIYRKYMDRDCSGCSYQSRPSRDWVSDKAPLRHYNRAIQLLLNQKSSDSIEITAVTLLVCYLFTCFDHLAGNYIQAMKHLRGGVELSRNIDKAMLNTNNSTHCDAKISGARTLICQVTKQIRRLDAQAVTFLVDWSPTDIEGTFVPEPPLPDNAFQSLDQAADYMQIIIARVMRLRWTEQQMLVMSDAPTSSSSLQNMILMELETWSSRFEKMLQQVASYVADSENYPLVLLLRLHHTIAWTLISSHGPGREMEYDNFLPQFLQCVTLAGEVAAARERYSESLKPTFTPEVGIIPVLYIIAIKCRHPIVRRQALGILQRQPMQEAVWDSISAARIIERVIEIEEGASEDWEMIQSMDRICMWQRIETLSWVHVVNTELESKLDITYNFCAGDSTYTESLMV